MHLRSPHLEIYPDRIAENARSVIALCHEHGAQVAAATKVTGGHPAVARALIDGGADMIADSRIANLEALSDAGIDRPLLLLRLPESSRVTEVVRSADLSLNSSLHTLRLLSDAAVSFGRRHGVLLMVDVGDLREGVWPDQAEELARSAAALPGLDVLGLGCNLACYGGVLPSTSNMRTLVQVRDLCRDRTGLELRVLSGGNSANLPLLRAGGMPKEINHFRIGEAILLGRNVSDRSPLPGTRHDTFRLVAEVIELESKPSLPIGETGQDAFGRKRAFVDRGVRRRAICNVGRQDVMVDALTPEDPGILVLGGSSDHLILDVQDAREPVQVGAEIAFWPGYGALLALCTSPYVQKVVLRD